MRPPSPTAEAAARQLLAGARTAASAAGGHEARAEPVAAIEAVVADVADALTRWFGPYGWHALLVRALTTAQRHHPALATVSVRGPLEPALDGLRPTAASHGAVALLDGVTAVIAGVIDLLGRMVGEDMALHLVARGIDGSATDAPDPTAPPMESTRARDS